MKNCWLLIVSLLLFISCNNGDSNGGVDYSNNTEIVGSWYNEYYKEFDRFYSSGAYYCEVNAPYLENPMLVVKGNYKLEGNKCVLNYSYDGYETSQSTLIIQSISQTKFTCKAESTGELYTFTKVYDEINLEYGESYTIKNLPFDAKIEKYESLSQGVVACTKDGTVHSVFPGIGYVKVYTDKGNVILRVVVPNILGFVLPDLSYALNKTASEITSLLGPAGFEFEDMELFVYFPNSNIVNELIFSFDETTHKTSLYMLELNKDIASATVVEYLESKYSAIPLESGEVMYQVNQNVVVFYDSEEGVLMYLLVG